MLFLFCSFHQKDNSAQQIDVALEKIRRGLESSGEVFSLFEEHKSDLEKIKETTVYSNDGLLTEKKLLLQTCQYILETKQKPQAYRPVSYTLQYIDCSHPDCHKSSTLYVPLEGAASDKFELYILENLKYYKKTKHLLDSIKDESLPNNLNEKFLAVKTEWSSLQETYESAIKHLQEHVWTIHKSKNTDYQIDQTLGTETQTTLKKNLYRMMHDLVGIESQLSSAKCSQDKGPIYAKLFEPQENQANNEQMLESVPKTEKKSNEPSDSYNKLSQSTSSTEQEKERTIHTQHISSPFIEAENSALSTTLTSLTQARTSAAFTASSSQSDDIINILLLGESGVGKSTFINAFVNYLIFKSLGEAEQGKTIVLIPVSFLMTTGNNFEEHIVKLGDQDNFNNEDFDHPGQSVTQHCKSYVFHMRDTYGKKIRIIDTPGFGDTRGLHQDDLNMQHILEYVNNLIHLNAICFLLKPNTSRINNFFLTCLNQLVDLLGPNARHNIVFCFTNARSTFYTPGDTAPLLKSLLKSFTLGDVPFKKENTFCFDNESFRYLVVQQNGIQFSNEERCEYECSWSKSVSESKRLFHYVCKQLSTYLIHTEYQSNKQAQLQINDMIRPMLEAIRNILRNMIMWNKNIQDELIELSPIVLHRPASMCNICKRHAIQIGEFWIAKDFPHEIQQNCYVCNCSSDYHVTIYYSLKYTCSKKYSKCDQDKMMKDYSLLCRASAQFSHFLISIARSRNDDPFLVGIVQMIAEENDFCQAYKSNNLNLELVRKLNELMDVYQRHLDRMELNQKHGNLYNIYQLIQTVNEVPMVKVQMDALKKSQKILMKQYECEYPK